MGTKFVDVPVMPCQDGYCQPPVSQRSITEGRTREIAKIRELGTVLAADSLVALDDRARALGLSRSTAWAILKANHKASGLRAATINRMLSSPELPPRARATILKYVEEKLAGLYGHNKAQVSRFAARCCSPSNRGHSPENRANSDLPGSPNRRQQGLTT